MSALTITAYVDGYDLEEVFASLELECHRFLVGRTWSTACCLISTHHPKHPSDHPDDYPQWDFGFNLSISLEKPLQNAVVADIQSIAAFVATLHARFSRSFVFGFFDPRSNTQEDFTFIDNDPSKIDSFIEILRGSHGSA